MSLYAGKDANNGNILHITSTANTKDEMKSATAIPSSCFHSSMEYLTYTEYYPTVIAGTLTYDGFNGALLYSNDESGFFIHFDGALLADVTTGNRLFVVNVDNTLIANGNDILTDGAFMYFTDSTSKSAGKSSYIDAQHPYMFIAISSISSCTIMVLNVSIPDGYIPPTVDASAGIYIARSQILVNGIDLLQFKYVSNVTINSVDTVVSTVGGTLQLINSASLNGPVLLSSNASETRIANGGNSMFTSLYGSSKLLFNSHINILLPAVDIIGGSIKDVLLTTLSINSLCCCFSNPKGGNLPSLPVYYTGTEIKVTLYSGDILGQTMILSFIFNTSGITYRYDLSAISSDTTISFNSITTMLTIFT